MPSPALMMAPATSSSIMNPPKFSPEMSTFQPISPAEIPSISSLSVSSNASITSSPPSTASFSIRLKNLPHDLSPRELKLLFTFAKDFSHCELLSDDYSDGSSSVIGIAYFKSYVGALDAHAVLNERSDIFETSDSGYLNEPSASGSPALSPATYPKMLICEILHNPQPSSTFDHPGSVSHGSISGPSSRGLPFSSLSSAGISSPTIAPSFNQVNSFPTLPALSPLSAPNGIRNGPQSAPPGKGSRFNFPMFEPLSPTAAATVPPGSEPEFFHQSTDLFSPNSTSPRGAFSNGTGDFPRLSGKAVLLESARGDDEEYENIVKDMTKDSAAWYSKPGSRIQAQQQQQQAQAQAQTQQPQQSQQVADRSRRNNSSSVPTRAFGSMSLNQNTLSSQYPPSGPTSMAGNGSIASGSVPIVTPPAGSPASQGQNGTNVHPLQTGGRVLPPANPADQNPPCNTLYVGNLPMDTSEDELKSIFSRQRGYKRLCFRTKMNGPMCFVEFEDVAYATRALTELYGCGLSNSVKGGIRLSFSKNPLGVRSNPNNNSNANNGQVANGAGPGSGHALGSTGLPPPNGMNSLTGMSMGHMMPLVSPGGNLTHNQLQSPVGGASQQQGQMQQLANHV
ncbi:uncharacterized protein V1516DRAFT_617899 [Lipomyces oligophaga]|uniref:uncharacterized protein n=1 Tax=Lipomyces oligophaga TaxID=45792 RepID=UPI0034CE999E